MNYHVLGIINHIMKDYFIHLYTTFNLIHFFLFNYKLSKTNFPIYIINPS